MSDLESNINAVLKLIAGLVEPDKRAMIAIAGPPGSGKSTLAEAIVARLNQASKKADLLPMDGYHLDVEVLKPMGLLARRGAPQTFDVRGFLNLIQQARARRERIEYPVFDRTRDCVIQNAGVLRLDTDIVIVEGNYLLLQAPVWQELRELFDLSVSLQPSMETLEERLMHRWLSLGFSTEEARQKVQGNDLRNAHLVLADSSPADLILRAEGAGSP